jgi:hypothetical protein
MGKVIAVSQSNYVPWKGYFDLINQVDEFVLYDEVQYTRRDWRNRNRIKTAHGPLWLTIPVEVKGKYLQKIRETTVSDPIWGRTHWRTLQHAYGRAPFFAAYKDLVEGLYLGPSPRLLSEINFAFLRAINGVLGVRTPLTWSTDFPQKETDPSLRLLEICLQAGADEYVSGPAAKAYLDEVAFRRSGVRVRWMDYSGYPEYPQLHPPFDHGVSILDLLFMQGPGSTHFMKSFRHAA